MSSASDSQSDFGRDHGLIHEVVVTGRKADWSAEDWAKLAHNAALMRDIRGLVHQRTESRRIIDCGVSPHIPQDWKIEQHRNQGFLAWDPKMTFFWTAKRQLPVDDAVTGHAIWEEIKNLPSALNANVLDYLLENQAIIPKEWRENTHPVFWGTIYRGPTNHLYVGELSWQHADIGYWQRDYIRLECAFFANSPALMRL
jgi:hypothetical protein